MMVALILVLGYVAVRAITFFRSEHELEAALAATVTPTELRKRLGHAETLGIRVIDVTTMSISMNKSRAKRSRKQLVLIVMVIGAVVFWDLNLEVAAMLMWAVLAWSSRTALAHWLYRIATQRGGQQLKVLATGLLLLALLYLGCLWTMLGARSWGWPADLPIDGTVQAAGGLLCLWCFTRRFPRMLARVAPSVDGAAMIREPGRTLWLRSFTDDGVQARAFGPLGLLAVFGAFKVRFEELVAWWSTLDGDLVTVGRPGEPYPLLGATRTYIPIQGWEAEVERFVDKAGVVLLIAGSGAGLQWEVDHVTGSPRRRTLLLLPPLGFGQSLARFDRLREQLGLTDLEQLDLEQSGASVQFSLRVIAIGFSETGRPVYYVGRGRGTSDLEAAVKYGQLSIRGRLADPPLHGEIQREFDPDYPLTAQ